MKKLFLFAVIIALLIPVLGSSAQDNSDGYSPEPGSPQDNECFEDGDWAGQCDSMWHWVCGWFLARHSDGVPGYEYENLPTWCNFVPPPLPEPQWTGGGGSVCLTKAESLAACNAWCPTSPACDGGCAAEGNDIVYWDIINTIFPWAAPDTEGCYPR